MYNRLHSETAGDETSANESRTETTDISTPMQLDTTAHRFYVPFCGLIFYVMTFLAYSCSFSLLQSLSVIIVAMVNETQVSSMYYSQTNFSDQVEDSVECPRDPEVKRADGELHWDRHQVSFLLAAYNYGYLFTPVRSVID